MGQDELGALSVPAKEQTIVQSVAEADAIPIWTKPSLTPSIPTSILKPKVPVAPSMTAPPITPPAHVQAKREWNTSKLGLRVGVDAMAAGAAGILVAPIITMIDKGIIENASGRNTLGDSLKKSALDLLSRPHRFVGSKPFVLIFVRFPTAMCDGRSITVETTFANA